MPYQQAVVGDNVSPIFTASLQTRTPAGPTLPRQPGRWCAGKVRGERTTIGHWVADVLGLLAFGRRAFQRTAATSGSWRPVLLLLLAFGLARGLLESALILLRAGHFLITLTQPYALRSYLVTGGAFLVANAVTAYVRWVLFAVTVFAVGRWLGGNGRLDQLLRVFGVALALYPLTILPDYLYLFLSMPAIRFAVSPVYNPVIGVGQIAVSIWLVAFGYFAARRVHGLGRLDSLLVGMALELASLGALVIGALVFFNLPPVVAMDHDQMILTATATFTAAAGGAAMTAWLLTRRAHRDVPNA